MAQENQGKGKPQQYVVSVNFTDDKGKQWTAGTTFTGDAEAVRKALAAGKIAARPPNAEPKEDDPA